VFLLGLCRHSAARRTGVGPLRPEAGSLAGLLAFSLAGVGCALSRSIEMLIGFRFVQGMAACVGPVIGRAVGRDHFSAARAAILLSSLMVVVAVAPFVAPTLGGQLLRYFSWRAIFWLSRERKLTCLSHWSRRCTSPAPGVSPQILQKFTGRRGAGEENLQKISLSPRLPVQFPARKVLQNEGIPQPPRSSGATSRGPPARRSAAAVAHTVSRLRGCARVAAPDSASPIDGEQLCSDRGPTGHRECA
jgi:hypothetical protein